MSSDPKPPMKFNDDTEWKLGFDFCLHHLPIVARRFKDAADDLEEYRNILNVNDLPEDLSSLNLNKGLEMNRAYGIRIWLCDAFQALAKIKNIENHLRVDDYGDYGWDERESARHIIIQFGAKSISPTRPTWEDVTTNWPKELPPLESKEFETLSRFFGKPGWYMCFDYAKKHKIFKAKEENLRKGCMEA